MYRKTLLAAAALILASCSWNITKPDPISEADLVSIEESLSFAVQASGGRLDDNHASVRQVRRLTEELNLQPMFDYPLDLIVLDSGDLEAWSTPGAHLAISRSFMVDGFSDDERRTILAHLAAHAYLNHRQPSPPPDYSYPAITVGNRNEGGNVAVGNSLAAIFLTRNPHTDENLNSARRLSDKILNDAGVSPVPLDVIARKVGSIQADAPFISRYKLNVQSAEVSGGERASRPESAAEQAVGLLESGEFERARELVLSELEADPDSYRLLGLRGEIELMDQAFDAAVNTFDNAIDQAPESYALYLGRGMAHLGLNDREAAIKDLGRSEQLLPTAQVSLVFAELLMNQDLIAEAADYFRLASRGSGRIQPQAEKGLERVDVATRPNWYLLTRAVVNADAEVVGEVSNPTDFTLRNVGFQFSATINGEARQQLVWLGAMPKGSRGTVSPKWKLKEGDQISNLSISVSSLEVRQ